MWFLALHYSAPEKGQFRRCILAHLVKHALALPAVSA